MKCVAFSDTHGYSGIKFIIPDGDLLIFAGDFSYLGIDNREIEEFAAFLKKLPHKHKVIIAGNHDRICYVEPGYTKRVFQDFHYLENEGVEIEGIKIWGSPITPTYGNYVFMKDRGGDIQRIWDLIPTDTDLLITHGPPGRICDMNAKRSHSGCMNLRNTIIKVRPKVHIFGHIHEGAGGKTSELQFTQFYNVSIMNEKLKPTHECTMFEI